MHALNKNNIKISKQIFALVLFTVLFLPIVQSINLSTIQKNKYSQVMIGESTEFIILFWNTENYSFPIELSVKQAPEEFSVLIRPEKFMLEPSYTDQSSTGGSREYVNTPQGIVLVTPVKIIVKPSNSVEVGEYDIYVRTVSRSTETGITPILEKTLKFTVNVTNPSIFERLNKITGRVTEEVGGILDRITGMTISDYTTNLMILLIPVVILLLVLLFKKFKKASVSTMHDLEQSYAIRKSNM